jgi:hypothetical protein
VKEEQERAANRIARMLIGEYVTFGEWSIHRLDNAKYQVVSPQEALKVSSRGYYGALNQVLKTVGITKHFCPRIDANDAAWMQTRLCLPPKRER